MIFEHPWQKQTAEMVLSSINQLRSDKRQAFLAFDQNVEQILKTYLNLPEEIIGNKMTFKERRGVIQGNNFYDLLMTVGKIAGEKLPQHTLPHVKYFHDVRNQLYHDGNGLTVEFHFCAEYAELVVEVLKALLGVDLKKELEKVLGETEMPVFKDFPDIENAINQYKILLHEYMDGYKKILDGAGAVREKVLSTFDMPGVKERTIEVIERYTAPFIAGVDENNLLVQSKKLDFDNFSSYKTEISNLILETRLKNFFLGLNTEEQNLFVTYLCVELPQVLNVLSLDRKDQDYRVGRNNVHLDGRISFFCTFVGIDLEEETEEYLEVMRRAEDLETSALDHLPRVYEHLAKLEKFKNI